MSPEPLWLGRIMLLAAFGGTLVAVQLIRWVRG